MSKLSAGIIGVTGYTGGEVLRILLGHPNVEVKSVYGRSKAGKKIFEIFPELLGYSDLTITDPGHSIDCSVDVLFLCLPHGESKKFIETNNLLKSVKKIVDLSTDYRDQDRKGDFVYGLTELNRELISSKSYVANPGCFATGIQLGLLPLAAASKLSAAIHITAITGSTGAGASLTDTSHFSWRNNNVSVYKAFSHQHLNEIGQSIKSLQANFDSKINWVPMRGNFTRGIFSSIYFETDLSQGDAEDLFSSFYESHPFTHLSKQDVDLKQVIGTNQCLINVNKCGDQLHITTAIDNLIKGAAGQAVENMNIILGLDQKSGLMLKPNIF